MTKAEVKRSLLKLSREFGKVLPVEQIKSDNPEVTGEDIITILEELRGEGIITLLDEETIQVNI